MEFPDGRALDVLGIVQGLGVELTQTTDFGEQWAVGYCPFHDDKNPSFSVSAEHGGWVCYAGCGKGQLPKLISLLNPDIDEAAAERWVLKFGVGTDVVERLLAPPRLEEEPLHPLPTDFPYVHGQTSPLMMARGFTSETLRRFDVGWSPEYEAIVIPCDFQGSRRGLIYRMVEPRGPKYLYTLGLPKRQLLFGWDALPDHPPQIVVTEGSLDAMWLHQAGIPGVAILGSVMSLEQAELLKGRARAIVLGFDQDEAGELATARSVKLLQSRATVVKKLQLPEGVKDVQEVEDLELLKALVNEAGPA